MSVILSQSLSPEVQSDALDRDAGDVRTLCVQKKFLRAWELLLHHGRRVGMKKRPKYEWSAGKQI